jgi:hypothetical protein
MKKEIDQIFADLINDIGVFFNIVIVTVFTITACILGHKAYLWLWF